jgi:PAS domain-containing protein
VRRTPTFRERPFASAVGQRAQRKDLDRVVSGELDRALIALDSNDGTVLLEAMLDGNQIRHVLATMRPTEGQPTSPPTWFAEWLQESPVIAWLKDLEGHYLYVNSRYTQFLCLAAEKILGRSDAELSPREAVDGPRLRNGGPSTDEPLQLEYAIAPFEGRPALVALRFPIRGRDGEPVAVCGVAAPAGEAAVARQECDRLLAIERWSRLSIDEARADVLEQWGLAATTTPVTAGESADVGHQADVDNRALATARAELEAALSSSALLEQQLGEERRHVAALREATSTAARRAHEMVSELAAERARVQELDDNTDKARTRLAELEDEVARERRRADDAERAVTEDGSQRERAAAEQAARANAEVVEARLRAERAEAEVVEASLRAERAEAAMEAHRANAQRAEAAAGQARAVAEQATAALTSRDADGEIVGAALEQALEQEREAAASLRAQLSTALHELEHARSIPAPSTDGRSGQATNGTHAVPAESVLRWRPAAQRALTAALAGASEWRAGLKDAIKILGTDGGWDAVTVWAPDDRGVLLRCVAMWTGPDVLDSFETLTWQKPLPPVGTELGQLFASPQSAWLTDLDDSQDPRLGLAAREGIRSALLVAVCEGAETIAAIELLSRGAVSPNGDVGQSMEAVALQLGHFSHLLRKTGEPRWRLGRL